MDEEARLSLDVVAYTAPQKHIAVNAAVRRPAMDHIGIDVHKRESQICILAEGGEVIERRIRTEPGRCSYLLSHPSSSYTPTRSARAAPAGTSRVARRQPLRRHFRRASARLLRPALSLAGADYRSARSTGCRSIPLGITPQHTSATRSPILRSKGRSRGTRAAWRISTSPHWLHACVDPGWLSFSARSIDTPQSSQRRRLR